MRPRINRIKDFDLQNKNRFAFIFLSYLIFTRIWYGMEWYGMLFNYDVDVILMFCSWIPPWCVRCHMHYTRCVILSNVSFAWIIYIIHHIVGLSFSITTFFYHVKYQENNQFSINATYKYIVHIFNTWAVCVWWF